MRFPYNLILPQFLYIFWAMKVYRQEVSCRIQAVCYNIQSFIYPPDAQIDCFKNVKIYITIYMSGAATCFGFSQPSSGSYCMCFAKVISINNQLKYVVDRL